MKTTELINYIYESVGDMEALAATLLQMAQFADSRATQLGVIDKSGKWSIGMMVGADPVLLQEYVTHYAEDDPRMAFSRRNPGRLAACHQIVDPDSFDRSPLVNDLLAKGPARFAMAAMARVAPRSCGALVYDACSTRRSLRPCPAQSCRPSPSARPASHQPSHSAWTIGVSPDLL